MLPASIWMKLCRKEEQPNIVDISIYIYVYLLAAVTQVRRLKPPSEVRTLKSNRVRDFCFLNESRIAMRRVLIYGFSKVPAFLNVVDIAGLVKGAAEGQGLGNNFLSHINACDGIFHLCRKSSINIRFDTKLFI